MHEIIPVLINNIVCKCFCVCTVQQVCVCVCAHVKRAARAVDSRGESALTNRGSRLHCCLVTRLNPEPPKQDLCKLFCFLFHPCNKNKIPQVKETHSVSFFIPVTGIKYHKLKKHTQRSYQAQYKTCNSEWQVVDIFSLTQKYGELSDKTGEIRIKSTESENGWYYEDQL